MLPWFAGLPLTCSKRPICGRPLIADADVRSSVRIARLGIGELKRWTKMAATTPCWCSLGPDAREQAIRCAEERFGAFDDIRLEPHARNRAASSSAEHQRHGVLTTSVHRASHGIKRLIASSR